MDAILYKKDEKKISKYGGLYQRVYFKCLKTNKSYRLDVYDNHTNSAKFKQFLNLQSIFCDLEVLDKTNIINGNSNFKYKGILNDNKETIA